MRQQQGHQWRNWRGRHRSQGTLGGIPEIPGGQQKGHVDWRDFRGDAGRFLGDAQRDTTADVKGTALGTPMAEKGRGRDTNGRGTAGGTRADPRDTRRDAAGSKGTRLGTFPTSEGHLRGQSMAPAMDRLFPWQNFENFSCIQILP